MLKYASMKTNHGSHTKQPPTKNVIPFIKLDFRPRTFPLRDLAAISFDQRFSQLNARQRRVMIELKYPNAFSRF
jgi:hypothetical protein